MRAYLAYVGLVQYDMNKASSVAIELVDVPEFFTCPKAYDNETEEILERVFQKHNQGTRFRLPSISGTHETIRQHIGEWYVILVSVEKNRNYGEKIWVWRCEPVGWNFMGSWTAKELLDCASYLNPIRMLTVMALADKRGRV